MTQLGLEVYTHNFTLHYPLGKTENYTGENVYAILRAPRASSTEALVLAVPYRPSNSLEQSTDTSLAVMLATAKFFRRQHYWAKDVIFLVTQHEQLGMQAWLEAYHQTSCGDGILVILQFKIHKYKSKKQSFLPFA
jgi:glycosylphosphatidylinositol transamidase